MAIATAADGTEIYYETHGDPDRPTVFLGLHFYASRGGQWGQLGVEDPVKGWTPVLGGRFHLLTSPFDQSPRGA